MDARIAEPALPHARAGASVPGQCCLSRTESGWEGAPHPSGLSACTKLTFVVQLLSLFVLVNRTPFTLVSLGIHGWRWSLSCGLLKECVMKHLLEQMWTECLTLAWQEWLPNNAGGSWLKPGLADTLMSSCVSVAVFDVCFVQNLQFRRLCQDMVSLQIN